MVLDPTTPDPTGAAATRDLVRRVEALERSNQLLASTIKGGALTVLDDVDHTTLVLGELAPGVYGIILYKAASNVPVFSVNQYGGFGVPWISTDWTNEADAVQVTSGSFANVWTTLNELLYATEIRFRIYAITDVGTTGEIKLTVAGGGDLGGTLTVPSGASQLYEYRFLHGLTIGTGPFIFEVKARRASGAGNLWVYHPRPMHYGTNMVPVAGGWV